MKNLLNPGGTYLIGGVPRYSKSTEEARVAHENKFINMKGVIMTTDTETRNRNFVKKVVKAIDALPKKTKIETPNGTFTLEIIANETKRTHLIDCPSCKRTSYCKCNIYHSICAICTFLQQQKAKGIKPIKSTILDRGTGVSRYAKFNEELVRDYRRRNNG